MTPDFARLIALPYSYAEVGATGATMPSGYRHLEVERRVGTGRVRFALVAERLLTWEMHRRAGLLVDFVQHPEVTAGDVATISILIARRWPIAAPVRVVEVVDEPTTRGFAYGTLPGHPESGEERFLVHLDPDGTVRATIRAFSRPARWFTRIGGPIARGLQDRVTGRYLDALAAD